MVNLPTTKYILTAEQLADIARQNNVKKLGILGGSFNPPHEGHMQISKLAMKLLGLDMLLWLVTPQNPFKDPSHRNNLAHRLQLSCEFVKKEVFYVSDLEQNLKAPYETSLTLDYIKGALDSQVQTYWIMGADNLLHIHTWDNWEKIFTQNKVIIFDRDQVFESFENCEAVKRFNNCCIWEVDKGVPNVDNCDWIYLKGAKIDISSTEIRAGLK